MPKTAEYYWSTQDTLGEVYDNCTAPVSGLPFSSFTFNTDDQCICSAHVDGLNLSFGLCLICPLGDFNPQNGGHLILHNLKMILEAAPGSMIFIPSALISHENVKIGRGERRHAITAYTPAAIFQHIDRMTSQSSKSPLPTPISHKELKRRGDHVWTTGVSLLPHISEFF